MKLLDRCLRKCRQTQKTILFADAQDVRVIEAVRYLKDNKLAEPVLVGSPVQVREFASAHGLSTRGIKVHKPRHDPEFDHRVRMFYEKRKEKGLLRHEAEAYLCQPLWYAADALARGKGDICIAGNLSTTAEVLRAGIRMVGLQEDVETVSSFFIMTDTDEKQLFAFADAAVMPRPTAEQLADIAISTARNFERLTATEARVALLSFSTNGSAEHAMTKPLLQALESIRERQPGLCVDGEIQFDAAVAADVAAKKMPDSSLAGRANVFIFPSLNAANIGYKLAQHLGGFRALGPFIQGLQYPLHDLSRGCTSEEIIQTAILASCMF